MEIPPVILVMQNALPGDFHIMPQHSWEKLIFKFD